VRIPPQIGKYSIYIIDEVHMLSPNAFNAFLKTLEEPPPHAIFILATTEKHKIIPTILSRCQIFDFNRIRMEDIALHLENIALAENIEAERAGLDIIAQKADGAMRDALSIFDQIVSFSGGKITYQNVIDNLNVLDYDYFFRLTDSILTGNIPGALMIFNEVLDRGFDGHNFINGLSRHFRDLLVCRDEVTIQLLEVGAAIREKYRTQAKSCSHAFILNALDLTNKCDLSFRTSRNQRLHVELCLVQLCSLQTDEKKKSEPSEGLLNQNSVSNVPVSPGTGSPAASGAARNKTGGDTTGSNRNTGSAGDENLAGNSNSHSEQQRNAGASRSTQKEDIPGSSMASRMTTGGNTNPQGPSTSSIKGLITKSNRQETGPVPADHAKKPEGKSDSPEGIESSSELSSSKNNSKVSGENTAEETGKIEGSKSANTGEEPGKSAEGKSGIQAENDIGNFAEGSSGNIAEETVNIAIREENTDENNGIQTDSDSTIPASSSQQLRQSSSEEDKDNAADSDADGDRSTSTSFPNSGDPSEEIRESHITSGTDFSEEIRGSHKSSGTDLTEGSGGNQISGSSVNQAETSRGNQSGTNTEKKEVRPSNQSESGRGQDQESEKTATDASQTLPQSPSQKENPQLDIIGSYGVNNTLSIKDALKGTLVIKEAEPEDSPQEADIDDDDLLVAAEDGDDFTEKELQEQWVKFANQISSTQPRLYNTLLANKPTITSQTSIEFEISNPLQEEALNKIKPELLSHLRRELNRNIELLFVINETIKESRLYQPEDKFEHMVKKNPALAVLKQKFNLDFD
jgi:DNA polymerase III gamma/tau subunit